MMRILYEKSPLRVQVTGHAGYAGFGKDIVCAAGSVLACTLAANVGRMVREGAAEQPVTRLVPGQAEIGCRPKETQKENVERVFDAVCAGFSLLAAQYPEYVEFRMEGNDHERELDAADICR